VLASGAGSNLAAVLEACADGRLDAQVVLVVHNRRHARAAERASKNGVRTHYAPLAPYRSCPGSAASQRRAYDRDLSATVAAAEPDLVILAGWMHLFSEEFLRRFAGRVVNVHPALPGCFPGAHAIDDAWAAHLADGLDHTGVMVHLVSDEGVDDGPVLAAETVRIAKADTRESLEERIHAVEHRLLVDAVAAVLAEGAGPEAVDPISSRIARGRPAE